MIRRQLAAAPAIPEVVEYLEPERDEHQRSASPPIMESRAVDSRARQPLRAYHSENIPSTHTRSESKTERPLQTTRRSPESPPRLQQRITPPQRPEEGYRAAPSAPAPVPLQAEVRTHTQTAPLPMTTAEPSRQAPPPPFDNKRMFVVSPTSIT